MTVDWLAVGDEVLKLAGAGVARLDEDEHPLVLTGGHAHEGNDPVGAEIGVDREGAMNARTLNMKRDF